MNGLYPGSVRLLLDIKVEVRGIDPDQNVRPSVQSYIGNDELPEGENGRELPEDLREAHHGELVNRSHPLAASLLHKGPGDAEYLGIRPQAEDLLGEVSPERVAGGLPGEKSDSEVPAWRGAARSSGGFRLRQALCLLIH